MILFFVFSSIIFFCLCGCFEKKRNGKTVFFLFKATSKLIFLSIQRGAIVRYSDFLFRYRGKKPKHRTIDHYNLFF